MGRRNDKGVKLATAAERRVKGMRDHITALESELADAREGLTIAYMKGAADANEKIRNLESEIAEKDARIAELTELARKVVCQNDIDDGKCEMFTDLMNGDDSGCIGCGDQYLYNFLASLNEKERRCEK